MTKVCTKCGESKSIAAFSKHPTSRDGLQSACKACAKIASAAWAAANRDKINAACAKWRAANPDKHSAITTAWRSKNREKHRATMAAWYAANPEARRIHDQNRRARKIANGGRLSPDIADKLFKLQRGKCACCHASIADGYHMDHRIPLALEGPNKDWNMQLLCGPCNLQKGAKHPIEFMQQRGFLL